MSVSEPLVNLTALSTRNVELITNNGDILIINVVEHAIINTMHSLLLILVYVCFVCMTLFFWKIKSRNLKRILFAKVLPPSWSKILKVQIHWTNMNLWYRGVKRRS